MVLSFSSYWLGRFSRKNSMKGQLLVRFSDEGLFSLVLIGEQVFPVEVGEIQLSWRCISEYKPVESVC